MSTPEAAGARASRNRTRATTSAARPIGTFTRKIQRHESASTSAPPTSGPIETPPAGGAPPAARPRAPPPPGGPSGPPAGVARAPDPERRAALAPLELLRDQRQRGAEH